MYKNISHQGDYWDAANLWDIYMLHLWYTKEAGGKYSNAKNLQNMHPLQLVAECTFVDEATLCIGGLELCTRTGVPLTSLAQLRYQLLGQLIDELLVTLQLV